MKGGGVKLPGSFEGRDSLKGGSADPLVSGVFMVEVSDGGASSKVKL